MLLTVASFLINKNKEIYALNLRQELERNVAARYLVAETDGAVTGYAGAWIILDESHITNIAVAEPFRGQGIGKKLTQALLQYLSNLGACYATLEVRVSNERALNLYKSLGFVSVGKRKRYLTPRECARLQSFPDSFIYDNKNPQAYKQFGNSINVALVKLFAQYMFGDKDIQNKYSYKTQFGKVDEEPNLFSDLFDD